MNPTGLTVAGSDKDAMRDNNCPVSFYTPDSFYYLWDDWFSSHHEQVKN